jgi:hypothetical protein
MQDLLMFIFSLTTGKDSSIPTYGHLKNSINGYQVDNIEGSGAPILLAPNPFRIMEPERNELRLIHEQLAEMEDLDADFELELDNVYLDSVYRPLLRGDGEDHKRMALMDFDVPAHILLVAQLKLEDQFETAHAIQGIINEYIRLFPGRRF